MTHPPITDEMVERADKRRSWTGGRHSWQVRYNLMPHEPIVERIRWHSYVVLPHD